jgi:hypothetical protein
MGKQYVNQHIVPKRYLDRFASHVDGKSIIGTRYYVKPESVKLYTHKQFRILDFISRIQVFAVY